jgi:hypothetical protein
MSGDTIDSRLGPFSDEILRFGFQRLSLTAMQNGVDALIFVLPRVDDTDALYRNEWESLSKIVREAGLTALSLEGAYGPLNSRSALKLASWDWHPNTEGHALLADRLYREFMVLDYFASQGNVGSTSTSAGKHTRPAGN